MLYIDIQYRIQNTELELLISNTGLITVKRISTSWEKLRKLDENERKV